MYRSVSILFRVKPVRAKLFRNGGSQAVRLPRECRFAEGESEVMVRRVGRRVVLEPVDDWSDAFMETLGSISGELPRPKQTPVARLRDPFAVRDGRSQERSSATVARRPGRPGKAAVKHRVRGIPRVAIDSTSVASVGYDEGARVLEIEFRGGRVYRYRDVPPAVHRLLLRAPSIGEFVNRIVRPRFEGERV